VKLALQTAVTSVLGIGAFALMLFVPAGTLNYWQGWTFIVVFALATLIPSVYLAKHDPAALKRRMKAGPTKETRPVQRVVAAVSFLLTPLMMVTAGLDHRFGWSTVSVPVVIVGDLLVAAGLVFAQWAVIQNGYAAATITVESEQPLVSTGLYGLVRHPLYLGALIMMVGSPFALASLWALLILIPGFVALAVRIFDEEKTMREELGGYDQYMAKVHHRLVPYVW
jgi:protein-S-isoprenylcysteine O-methyltransferase Ste14